MTTPIRRRFKVDTLLLDQTAPVPVLDVPALITTNDLFTGDRWTELAEDEWSEAVSSTSFPVEHAWLTALFGQSLKPNKALIIFWDKLGDPAEALATALDDAVNTGAAWYQLHYIGHAAAALADQLLIAQYNQSFEEKTQCMLLSTDVANLTASTGIAYQCLALTLNRTSVIYHPTGTVLGVDMTNQRPDAAISGRMLPTDEGAEQWDYKALSLVSDSNLTSAQQNLLRANGANFVERFKNTSFTHVFPGRTCTGREIRTQWGADWYDTNAQASLANYAFRTPLMAFDNDTFTDVEGILRDWSDRAVARRIIQDDYVINLPDPDTVPASVRATGIAQFNNVYTATLISAVDQWQIQGTWSIGGI